MIDLPGQAEAGAKGYSIHSFCADKSSATYIDYDSGYGISLVINDNKTCELVAAWKMITLRTGLLSFPNINFKKFEDQMKNAVLALRGIPDEKR